MSGPLASLLAADAAAERRHVRQAAACAAALGAASSALLGVSGWFIAGAAAAGAAGIAAAHAFNYLLPSAAIRLLAIVRTGARYGERLFGHGAALLAAARVRPALLRALLAAPPARALAVRTGEATGSLVQDVQAVEHRLVQRSAAWSAGASAAMGLGLCGVAGWAPLLSTAGCLGALAIATQLVARGLRRRAAETREALGALRDALAPLAAAAPELRCHGLTAWAAGTLTAHGDALNAAQQRQAALASLGDALGALACGSAAVLAMLASRHAGAPLAALAGLAAAMTVEGMAPLWRGRLQRDDAAEAARRLDALLDTPAALPPGTTLRPNPQPDIVLLHPGPVHLPAGARAAIVGPSGCGKTTLVETLLGLRPAAPGTVRIGGVDAAQLAPSALRACFAWLPQDAALLAGSVRDNLRLAGDGFDEAALWRALHDAAIDDVVRALPQGLDTWLGEDGARLSGGERRRVALARALLADAPWLLLDEPTEGLDAHTEALLLQRLAQRLDGTQQSLLVVTHRRAVVACCRTRLVFGTGDAAHAPPHAPASEQPCAEGLGA